MNTGRVGGRGSRGNVIEDEGFSFLSALKLAASGGAGGDISLTTPIWMGFWMTALWCVAFPVSSMAAAWYICLLPLSAMFESLNGTCDYLLKGVQATGFCARHMMAGTPVGEAFK